MGYADVTKAVKINGKEYEKDELDEGSPRTRIFYRYTEDDDDNINYEYVVGNGAMNTSFYTVTIKAKEKPFDAIVIIERVRRFVGVLESDRKRLIGEAIDAAYKYEKNKTE